MSNSNWWARPARPEEQGSFSDAESGVGYENVSKPEAIEQQETAMRRGDEVNEPAYELADYNDDVRFNTNRTATDAQGYEYDERYKPGN
jgi:hypothetical protein